ncbi:MAG: DUF421 domain-containing protein [Clostridia bacterium]|nr:DUF421 domain-containing protein [Clostridia bacterium]
MAVTLIRTFIIFITLIIVMRLMGKRQIGEMQPYEFIVTLIIADLATIPMADVSIPLTYGIVAILGLFLLHQLLSLLEQGGDFFKIFISGKPSIVINKNGIDMKELKRNNMGVEDLIESMRSGGYFALDDLDYAIFESNGKLSAVENKEKDKKHTSLPLIIISDGKANKKNLRFIQFSEQQLTDFVKSQNGSIKRTEVLTIDGEGRVYYKAKDKKFKILSLSLAEGVKW